MRATVKPDVHLRDKAVWLGVTGRGGVDADRGTRHEDRGVGTSPALLRGAGPPVCRTEQWRPAPLPRRRGRPGVPDPDAVRRLACPAEPSWTCCPASTPRSTHRSRGPCSAPNATASIGRSLQLRQARKRLDEVIALSESPASGCHANGHRRGAAADHGVVIDDSSAGRRSACRCSAANDQPRLDSCLGRSPIRSGPAPACRSAGRGPAWRRPRRSRPRRGWTGPPCVLSQSARGRPPRRPR